MAYTPYDWNQAVQQRTEYTEERLRDGSPVVGMSTPEGVFFVTIHQTQRKLYEIYDRLMFGGVGNQSDLEAVRNAAIDFAHREGFQRSPDDVTLQRMVGAALSPAVKRGFSDPFAVPFVFRGLFAELGPEPSLDVYYCLNYDGEYSRHTEFAVVGGSAAAENEMTRLIHDSVQTAQSREQALKLSLEAWAAGWSHARAARNDVNEPSEVTVDAGSAVRDALVTGTLEVGLLERNSRRESRFRLLALIELETLLTDFR